MLNELIYLILITLIPTIELRGAIPIGIIHYGLNPILVFLTTVIANVLLIIPIYVFLGFFFELLMKIKIFQSIVKRIHKKTTHYVDKYGFFGLVLFVAVPFPGTGVYSGVLGAYLLGVRKRDAIPALSFGVLIAGIIVTVLSVLTLNGVSTFF